MYGDDDYARSEITLVDDRLDTSRLSFLTLSRDDMKNTEIYSRDGRSLYTVTTNSQTRMHTVVSRAVTGAGPDTRHCIAKLERRDWRPDMIRFAGCERMKLSSWIRGRNGKWSDL